jgi:hypothetical protein
MSYLLNYKGWKSIFEQDIKDIAPTGTPPTEEPTVTSSSPFGSKFNIEGFVQPDATNIKNAGEWNQAFEDAYFKYLGTDPNAWKEKTILVFNRAANKLGYSPKLIKGSFKLKAFYKGYNCYPSATGSAGNLKYGICETNPTLYLFNETPTTDWTGDIKTSKYKSEADISIRPIVAGDYTKFPTNVAQTLQIDDRNSESLRKVVIIPLNQELQLSGAYGNNVIVPNSIYLTLGKMPIGTLVGEKIIS